MDNGEAHNAEALGDALKSLQLQDGTNSQFISLFI